MNIIVNNKNSIIIRMKINRTVSTTSTWIKEQEE